MKKDELLGHQFEFEKNRKNLAKELKPITILKDKFVKDYTVERVGNLKLDEYVIGKQRTDSFCYRIENELNDWGNIHGSTSTKFGVYYGKFGEGSRSKYRIGKKTFGSTIDDAFERVKEEIQGLLCFEQGDNYGRLKANLISPMFKGKILSLYFPDEFLNIYSKKHLNHFINGLAILSDSKSELDKQRLLMNYKNADPVMREWTTFEFGRFLYMTFNTPNVDVNENDISKGLKGQNMKDLPPIESVRPKEVEVSLDDLPESKGRSKKSRVKTDYEKKNKNAKKIGDRGEMIVMKYEKEQLQQLGKNNLASKVKMVSLTNDAAGYDILSFFPDGTKKYIEVKSTVRTIGYSTFFITANEYEVSQELENYLIYLVYEAHSKSPSISVFAPSSLWTAINVRIEPNSFKVTLKTM